MRRASVLVTYAPRVPGRIALRDEYRYPLGELAMAERGYSFSTTSWPLVEVEFRAPFSDAELRDYLGDLAAVLERRSPYVMCTDASRSSGISAASRRELSDFIAKHRASFDAYQLGNAVMLRSAVHRGMLTALTWMSPMPGNVRPFETAFDGMAWLRKRWREATGSELP